MSDYRHRARCRTNELLILSHFTAQLKKVVGELWRFYILFYYSATHLYHASYLQQRQLSAVFFSDFFQGLKSFLLLPRNLASGKPQGVMERWLKNWPKDSSGGRLLKTPPTMVFQCTSVPILTKKQYIQVHLTSLKRRDCINWYIDKACQLIKRIEHSGPNISNLRRILIA